MSDTFSYVPDFGASKTTKPNVSQIAFGDGYKQRIAKGINTQPEIWNLVFSNRDLTEKAAIEDFFVEKNAVEAFYWQPSGGDNALFICTDWTVSIIKGTYWTITATFEKVFD